MKGGNLAGLLLASWLAASCGGGDTPLLKPAVSDETAPDNLSYHEPNLFTEGVPITPLVPTVDGTPTNYMVEPELPRGLKLGGNGVISGTPDEPRSPAIYLVTAGNSAGTSSFGIRITVMGRFKVGGFVSGLAGAGLVLTNNGGDDLAVSANGAFTFSRTLPARATFDVAVAAQPAGQTCSVAGGRGEITNEDFGTVNVTCGATVAKATRFADFSPLTRYLDVRCPAADAAGLPQMFVVDRVAGSVKPLIEPALEFPDGAPPPPSVAVCGTQSIWMDGAGAWVYVADSATRRITVFAAL